MKLLTAVAALAIAACASFPVVAQEASAVYFTQNDRTETHALGIGGIGGRYPRPLAGVAGMNIPNGAGAPVPIDPFTLPRPYALGETYVETWYGDAKGRATHDAKGRAAWDGAAGRMSFGN